MLFNRRKKDPGQLQSPPAVEDNSYSTFVRPRGSVIRARLFRSFIYIIALIFIILVEIGSLSDKPVLRDTYFLKLDLSNIIPVTVPDAALINSIARSIGLHDFYQVGLWNFCEGYSDGSGITYCSPPETMYSFNPVTILMNELLAGATIALPGDIHSALNLARIASNWMFALFLVSAILTFLCIFLTPFSVPSTTTTLPPSATSKPLPAEKATFKTATSKKFTLPLMILTFLAFIMTIAASVVATALFVVFKFVFANAASDLNLSAELGTRMLVFMWIAVAFTFVGFVMHCYELCSCCCCLCSPRQKKRRKFKRFVKKQKKNGTWTGPARVNSNANGEYKNTASADGTEMSEMHVHERQDHDEALHPVAAGARDTDNVNGLQQYGLHGLGRSLV